jgi:hypothetical protein
VRNYGYYIGLLEERREHLMGTWRLNDGAHRRRTNSSKPYPLVDMIEFTRCYGRITQWFDLIMGAPLVFIGCSLAPDEWPLWWLLHQRARNAAPFPPGKRPATYVLVVGDPPEHLEGQPCDIEVVPFPSFDRMWSFVRKALAS